MLIESAVVNGMASFWPNNPETKADTAPKMLVSLRARIRTTISNSDSKTEIGSNSTTRISRYIEKKEAKYAWSLIHPFVITRILPLMIHFILGNVGVENVVGSHS